MSNRITKQAAAMIAGMHDKTLDTWIKEDRNGITTKTGYQKNLVNARVTFDEAQFRIFMSEVTGDDKYRAGLSSVDEPDAIDAEIIPAGAMTRKRSGTLQNVNDFHLDQTPGQSRKMKNIWRMIHAAPVMPHRSILTVDEAVFLSGLPKWFLKDKAVKVRGRNWIDAAQLEKFKLEFLKPEPAPKMRGKII